MSNENFNFPKIGKSVETYLFDEEGNISRNKVLAVGSLVILMSMLYSMDVFARHSSHSSHGSHSSHSSSSNLSSYHSSHVSHQSHQSHVSGSGHSSAHVNSAYAPAHSSGSGVATKAAGAATTIKEAVVSALEAYPLTSGWDCIFNATYYAEHNADVVNAVGNSADALLKHFQDYGMAEGRQGCTEFNVEYYKANYTDLVKAYGTDLKSYYIHYKDFGKAEGRIGYTKIQ